jgi:hypothetical protein
MYRRFMKKRVAVALSAIAALALAAGAYAFFSSTGTGSGSATVGSSTPFSVSQTASDGKLLYPDAAVGGANIQTETYTVTNPSAGKQNLNKVIVSIPSTWSAQSISGQPACTASSFSIGGQPVGSPWTDTSQAGDLTAGQTVTSTVKLELIDNGANQDNCQGVTVPLVYSAS